MQTWRVPIDFYDHRGVPPTNIHQNAHPFIEIELAAARGGEEADWTRTRALVDTGASYTMISPQFLRMKGCIQLKTIEMAGNFSRHQTPFYKLCIRAVGAEVFTLECEVAELNVPLDDGECLAVLGMDYLRFGRTLIEGPLGESHFDLLESRIRLAQETARPPTR